MITKIEKDKLYQVHDDVARLFQKVDWRARAEFGDGTNPDLQLHLILDNLKKANANLKQALTHVEWEILR